MRKYIYIDTKIKGTINQLLSYFDEKVFDSSFIVIYRLYKKNKSFLKLLDENHIHYKVFRRYKDLPSLANSIVFYLFNAQSNCRIISYREAKHIFVTHGESNKLPSIKPILRVYDFITVAGNAGVDRLLENRIFTECDIKNKKIVRMGNTFIGNTKYTFSSKSNIILYAPTWEGGIPQENYTSIDEEIKSFKLLYKYSHKNDINSIIIQFHPNTGHRDKAYIKYISRGIDYLIKRGIKVLIREINLNYIFSFKYRKLFISKNAIYNIKIAFCDVSAIETQLLDKKIPYYIFFNSSNKAIPSKNKIFIEDFYKCIGIFNFKIPNKEIIQFSSLFEKVRNYYISYENKELEEVSYKDKVNWLVKRISHE